jgi:hypothetical protein
VGATRLQLINHSFTLLLILTPADVQLFFQNTKVGTELDYVIARKNPKNSRHVDLDLRVGTC